ncbi:GtrA family protein [Halorubellus sp. JP-L1]|uniref:GtrA family protein n=1 Tax=Halorubellus sp. JP-L1 TaxID=2715753 RepID=UPI001409B8CF|nr:GtrA family protein [Halorubellus sp. JP-L1]NHN42346.1 GtrA family protein [Halorubellus sp. JP-L1]
MDDDAPADDTSNPATSTTTRPSTTDDRSVLDRFRALLSGVRFAEFASVGAVGAVLDTTLLLVLTGPLGVATWLSKLASAEAAILLMFAVNERWTFAGEGDPDKWPVRLAKSNLVRVGGVLVATGVVTALDAYVDVSIPVLDFDLWLVFANGAGIAAGLLVNYVAESLFTWRVHE